MNEVSAESIVRPPAVSRPTRRPPRRWGGLATRLLVVVSICFTGHVWAASAQPGPNEAVRIRCVKRGVYKITGVDLKGLGLNLRQLDPSKLALVHFDRPVPFYLKQKRPDRMGPDDALYFFAKGGQLDTVTFVNMDYDYAPRSQTLMLYLNGTPEHRRVYRPVQAKLPVPGQPVIPNRALSGRYHFEDNDLWEFFDAKSQTDYIYWAKLTRPHSQLTSSSLTNPFMVPWALLDPPITIKAKFQGVSRKGRHNLEISVNDQNPKHYQWGAMEELRMEYAVDPASLKRDGNLNMVTFRLEQPTGENLSELVTDVDSETGRLFQRSSIDVVMLDWFDVEFKQASVVVNDYAEFLVRDEMDRHGLRQCRISGFKSPEAMVFDPDTLTVWDGGVFSEGEGERKYHVMNIEHPSTTSALIAVSDPRCHTAPPMRRFELKGLFDRPDDCELLILTHPLFWEELLPLVEWKRSRGLRVSMVSIFDLFNERTGGYPSPHALRDYLRHVHESQPEPQLRYVMLVGDASSISKYKTYCPNYAYIFSGDEVNENFFGNFEDPFGRPEVAVGRLSVKTKEDTRLVVNKIINYESGRAFGPWRARFFTIAANPNWATAAGEEMIQSYFLPHYLSSFVETTLDNDAPDYAETISKRVIDEFNQGSLFASYIGHGGGTIWELGPTARPSEFTLHLFDQKSVTQLVNVNQLPVVYSMSCYTNNFDNPHISQTMGETFILSKGGAIAVIGAAARSDIGDNYRFLDGLFRAMHERRANRLGDAMVRSIHGFARRSLGGRFLLLGDPSLEFTWPRPDLELEGAELDPDDQSVTFHYKLPEEIALPAQVDCFLVDKEQTVLAQWAQRFSEREGTVLYQASEQADIAKTDRIVIYTNQQGTGDFIGAVQLDKDENKGESEMTGSDESSSAGEGAS